MTRGRTKRVSLRALALLAASALTACEPKPAKPPGDLLTVSLGDAVFRTEATGRIVPQEEVFVRSQVAGLLEEIKVKPGDWVEKGTHIATVHILADPVTLGEARAQLSVAEARLASASREHARLGSLEGGTAMSLRELARAEDDERLARAELEGARKRLRLIAEGVANPGGGRSTRVVATVDGAVLAIPVAVGDFVSDTNSYRDGTTIAVLADMRRLLFKGQIEEAHVGKLKLGMPASIKVGALQGVAFDGRLTWIAPRATVDSSAAGAHGPPAAGSSNLVLPLTSSTAGITRFELWVELQNPPKDMRAGYTASAEFTLERHQNVPVVDESALRFEHGKVFARVYRAEGTTEEREVTVGVSDGVKIEIVSGLSAGDRIALYEAP